MKRLLDLATRLKLDAEQSEAKSLWVAAELKTRRAKLKEDDVAGLKALLVWAEQKAGGVGAEELAREVVKLDPKDETAHLLLGHIRDGDNWVDPWDLLVKRGGLKDVKVRYEIHKMVEAAKKRPAVKYPPEPLASLTPIKKARYGVYWLASIPGDGKGRQYVFAPPFYTPAKTWPLIVALHGGGSGPAEAEAHSTMSWYSGRFKDEGFICIVPIARNHVINSWNIKENMLDVIDGIEQACQLFHIDLKRIYLEGASMGAQGTSRFSWVVPELFAAFSPQAGAYWNNHPVPDLTGKPFLVFHGGKDEDFRNKSLNVFLKKIRQANASVEYNRFPDAGHFLPYKEVYPKVFEFFRKHTNDFAPDLKLVRRVIEETVIEKPAKPPK